MRASGSDCIKADLTIQHSKGSVASHITDPGRCRLTMEENTLKLIEYWKKHSPRPKDQIPFGSIMNALGTEYSAVELKEEAVGRWGVSVSPIPACGM